VSLRETESGGDADHSRRSVVADTTGVVDNIEIGSGKGRVGPEPIPPANAVVFLDTLVFFGKENPNLVSKRSSEHFTHGFAIQIF
jgi:hypothetical protein